LAFLEEMRRKDPEPDVIIYSAVISACEKGQQPERALELLEEMRQERLEANASTFRAVISAGETGMQPEGALVLLEETRQAGLDVITYYAVICACEQGKQPEVWQAGLNVGVGGLRRLQMGLGLRARLIVHMAYIAAACASEAAEDM